MTIGMPPPADPTPTTPGVPPGWYQDPASGQQRWWDGQRWTEHFNRQPVVVHVAAPAGNGSATAALVLGLVGLFLTPIPFFIGLFVGGIPAVLAIIFGIAGAVRADAGGSGRGLSVAGIILGSIAVIGIFFGSGTVW